MLRTNKEMIVLTTITLLSLILFLFTVYRYISFSENYDSLQAEISRLQRENTNLQYQIKTKEQEIVQLKEQKENIIKSIEKFPPFNSPELIGKRISEICVTDNMQILNLNSALTPKENFSLTTSVVLKGKEQNAIKAIKDILNSFPLSLKAISLFNNNGTTLQMSWKTPIINLQELGNETD
ncbi:hypothetical protein SAMN06265339_1053 [Desulfurobacterium pacificum]|uniref:Uncharacterized protein n=1 Tax=Desulfurobacterium pacificum TaxID=240166 RepID=A0ABY1NLG1_9BACT|nr:hypothetical protein [Desulfurobacterium pacificum]SMP12504.1 hypothetical protein SAMN06265339_1053 [Desulfurobacterium pacificum]